MAKNTTDLPDQPLSLNQSVSVSGSDSAEGAAGSVTEPVTERRREQIRRAQKLHRQRKAEHSRRVTVEIADLRAKNAEQTARISQLERTVAYLSDLLHKHNVPHERPDSARPQPQAQVFVRDHPTDLNPSQFLQVSLPPSSRKTLASPNLTQDAPVDFTDVQLAIDFILALEQPCLYHHHGHVTSEEDPPVIGHVMMMQTPIMSRGPNLINPSHDSTPILPPSSSWTVPSEELERLLTLSDRLSLSTEVTPVQAWAQIREFGQIGWAPSQTQLNRLLLSLKPMVICEGFGAAIKKAAFENLLNLHCQF